MKLKSKNVIFISGPECNLLPNTYFIQSVYRTRECSTRSRTVIIIALASFTRRFVSSIYTLVSLGARKCPVFTLMTNTRPEPDYRRRFPHRSCHDLYYYNAYLYIMYYDVAAASGGLRSRIR